jgi:hypothetical protein
MKPKNKFHPIYKMITIANCLHQKLNYKIHYRSTWKYYTASRWLLFPESFGWMNVYNSLRYLGLWFNITTLSCSAPITSHVTSIKWAQNMPGSMHWRVWNLVGFLSISIKVLGGRCSQASCCLAKNYGMSNLHSWRCNSLMKKTEERIPYWEAGEKGFSFS